MTGAAIWGTNFWEGLFIILNILFMETLLSVDNAAVLAIMVRVLPENQRTKALEYGIWGAFILRGAALCLASVLISIWWLKAAGGFYLMYLCYGHFSSAADTFQEEEADPNKKKFFKWASSFLSPFWATVALVEVMDMAFSLDNIFAVTSFTSYIGLIVVGVFIGIVMMRVVSSWFSKLMDHFPFMESLAYIVIGVLGIKLALTCYTHYYTKSPLSQALNGHAADIYTSLSTVAIFFVPVLTCILFNIPKKPVPPGTLFEDAIANTYPNHEGED